MCASDTRRHGDGGQATLLVLAVATIVVVLMVAVGRFGALVIDIEQAQVAADAAALAAVDGGAAAAARVAAANDAQVVDVHIEGDAVQVTVEFRGHRATARATRAP